MKKILLVIFLLVFSVFVFHKNVYASCDEATCCFAGPCGCDPVETCGTCRGCSPGGSTVDCTKEICNPVIPITNRTGPDFVNKLISVLVSLALIIGSLVFFFMLLLGAVKWISSEGEKGKLESAQKQITSALTGLVILFSIFAIIKVIEKAFGLSITAFNIPVIK